MSNRKINQHLADMIGDSIIVVDPNTGRLVDVNQECCNVHGYSKEEMLELGLWDISQNCTNIDFLKLFLDRVKEKKELLIEGIHKAKSGETFPVELHIRYIEDGDNDYIIAVARDLRVKESQSDESRKLFNLKGVALEESAMKISELEQKLFHNSRLAQLGILCTEINHEINNSLSVMALTIQSMIKNNTDQRFDEPLRRIKKSNQRIADLVDQTRNRTILKTHLELKEIDINELVNGIVSLLTPMMEKNDISLEITSQLNNGSICGDFSQLETLLMNLLFNAKDSFRELDLEREKSVQISLSQFDEKHISIKISDNAKGISQENLDKLFKPFFTTKRQGEGTGLGLALSRKIVENHHGNIQVESTLDNGSCFTITFPRIV
jgi:PAS domain S-box-containing protein